MKYILQGTDGTEICLWPHDNCEPGENQIFSAHIRYSDETKKHDDLFCADIPASEFYQFIDNIKRWAPDIRKKSNGK